MSQLGIASRRAAEEMMEHGRIRINGKLAQVGDHVDTDTDTLEVDGRRIKLETPNKLYIAIYKPKNVVTTNVGHRGDHRQIIRDLVPHEGHLFTIGRLDVDSEGLVVLTNDGALAQKLSHPSFQHTKTYKVVVQGLPKAETVEKWQRGVMLEEGMTGPASVRIVKGANDLTTLRIVMTEGKKRQIRRVAQILGHPVKRLVRTRIGMLELGTLKPGEWRELTARDVEELSTPSPELKAIKQLGSRRGHFGRERAFDADAKPGRRGRPTPETSAAGERGPGRPPRRTTGEETAPGGYESDRKPMRRGRPTGAPSAAGERGRGRSAGAPSAAGERGRGRPPRRTTGEETAPGGYESDRKPMRRGRPGAGTGAPSASGDDTKTPRRRPDGDSSAPTRDGDRKPLRRGRPGAGTGAPAASGDDTKTPRRRSTGGKPGGAPSSSGTRRPAGGRPGAKRGRPSANNPGAVRRPRPAKRGPRRDSES